MNIYFAGSITGGRGHAGIYPTIIAILQERGTVLTEHVGSQALDGAGETALEARAIFTRDVAWVDAAALLVAEVTTPSLGVGYEIGRAEARQIPIIALFDAAAPGRRLSAMIGGNPSVRTICYTDPDHLAGALRAALEET